MGETEAREGKGLVSGHTETRHVQPYSYTKVWEASLRLLGVWAGRKPGWGSWEVCTRLSLDDKWPEKEKVKK